MALQLEALDALQKLDTQIEQLRRERARLDDASALRREMDARRARHTGLEERLHQLRVQLQDAELELKSVEAKKKEFERRLYEGKVTNPKELTAIEKEIEMLGRQRGRLDETILTLMDSIDTATGELAAAAQARDTAEAAWRAADEKYRTEAARLETALRELVPLRQQAAAAIEPATLRRYDDLRARASNLAVVHVVEKACAGCHTTLTAGVLRRLQEGTAYVYCENCSRFLIPG
jgi:predicted  nucleic acid-binding Zn-ribbon protein